MASVGSSMTDCVCSAMAPDSCLARSGWHERSLATVLRGQSTNAVVSRSALLLGKIWYRITAASGSREDRQDQGVVLRLSQVATGRAACLHEFHGLLRGRSKVATEVPAPIANREVRAQLFAFCTTLGWLMADRLGPRQPADQKKVQAVFPTLL